MEIDVPTPPSPSRRGRGWLPRATLTAVLGLALVLPGTYAAPAQAGILDPITDPLTQILDPITGQVLTAPTPKIGQGEAGRIEMPGSGEMPGQIVCSSDGSVEKLCDPLPLDVVGSLLGAALPLEAVPDDPSHIPEWGASCPQATGALCTLALELLTGTPLAPLVRFRAPSPEEAAAPETSITSGAPGAYSSTHTFTFAAEPPTASTAYECQLQVTFRGTPPTGAEAGEDDWVPCGEGTSATRRYTGLAPADYVFAVRAAADATSTADPTPATQSFRLSAPPVPATTVVSGPRSGGWLLGNRVTYRFRSSVSGSSFTCRYDGALQGAACNDGVWSLRAPAPGSHRFTVAARADGVSDPSPAGRVFHVPLDDRQLRGVGRWVNARQRGAFRTTVRATRVRGAGLATRGRLPVKRVVLVADRGRGHGTVKVYLGSRLLKRVSLYARRAQKRAVIPIATFRGVRRGRVRVVVVSSGRPVRIDGLGVTRR